MKRAVQIGFIIIIGKSGKNSILLQNIFYFLFTYLERKNN